MLNLSRRVGETVLIGDDCSVKVLEIRGHKVKLGFDAPDDVVILREELKTGSRTRPIDYGPVSMIAHRLYLEQEGHSAKIMKWSEIPPEIQSGYRNLAEQQLQQWRETLG